MIYTDTLKSKELTSETRLIIEHIQREFPKLLQEKEAVTIIAKDLGIHHKGLQIRPFIRVNCL